MRDAKTQSFGKGQMHETHITDQCFQKPVNGGIVACRSVSVRERLVRFLLGEKQRLTIIVPGDSVRELAISEVMEGGTVHGAK